jgi:hypothetical protein
MLWCVLFGRRKVYFSCFGATLYQEKSGNMALPHEEANLDDGFPEIRAEDRARH